MPAPTWVQITDDSFTNSNTVTGSAGTTTGVPVGGGTGNGWTDVQGSIWNINSNELKATTSDPNGYKTAFLTRPAGEAHTNQRCVIQIAANPVSTAGIAPCVRWQSGSKNYYMAQLGNNAGTGNFFIYKIVGGAATAIVTVSGVAGYNSAHAYQVDISAYGVSPTTIAYKVTDLTTNTVVLNSTTTDSEATLQTSGVCAIVAWQTGPSLVTHATTYTGDFAVQTPTITASDPTGVTFAVAGVNGATPYTLQLQRATTPDGSYSNVTGATGTTPKDTTGTLGQVYWYQVHGTDNNGATYTSQPIPASAQASPSLVIGLVGDSILDPNQGANLGSMPYYTPDSIKTHLMQQFRAIRYVTVNSQAVSGKDSGDWVPGTTLNTNAKSAFATAGVTYVVVMLGLNDARVPASSLVAGHRSVGTATDGTTAGGNGSYMKNMATIVSDLVSSGYKVVIVPPGYALPTSNYSGNVWDTTTVDLLQQYGAALSALVDNSTIFGWVTSPFDYLANAVGEGRLEFYPINGVTWNGVDPSQQGVDSYAAIVAEAVAKAVGLVSSGGGSKRIPSIASV